MMKKYYILFLIIFIALLKRSGDKPNNTIVPDTTNIYEWNQLVTKPEIINHEVPIYPEALRSANITGTAIVEVIIEKTGEVDSARVVESSGNVVLDSISLNAAKTFIFMPTKVNGELVRVVARIPFMFKLEQ